jgi:hypothetical protein
MPSPSCGHTEPGVRSRYRDCDLWAIPSECSGYKGVAIALTEILQFHEAGAGDVCTKGPPGYDNSKYPRGENGQ